MRIFVGLYCTELSLKIAAFGLIYTKNSYLREFWNIYDMVLLGFYIYHIQNTDEVMLDVSPFRMLRLLSYFGSIFEGILSFSLLFKVWV